ncbi:MAG: DUF309 domain-containing protein [Deltaproteobacteria bacterium]|nr:MAG: DUF309 domain-containing protein [Deltaproteobacteria bacterium]
MSPPGRPPPRYTSRPLPPYAFLPGRAPHPTRDPRGHSYGVAARADYLPADRWRDNDMYLWGIDLLNAGYPWEAHEAWEAVWTACRAAGDADQAAFVQGLIQLAAAEVHERLGEPDRAARIRARARAKLAAAPAGYLGLASRTPPLLLAE